jgi:hypothetical protein
MQKFSRISIPVVIGMFLAACGAVQSQPGSQNTAASAAPTTAPIAQPAASTVAPTTAVSLPLVLRTDEITANWTKAWLMNTTGEASSVFKNVLVNVTEVTTKTINGKTYQCIKASGIPNYKTAITDGHVHALDSRQKAATDFATGATTAKAGDIVPFGANIGYDPKQGCVSGSEGYGYWPPGPACPKDQKKEQCFPLEPEPATTVCETGLSSIGTWVNGVGIFNWTDGMSYKNQRVWQNEAYHFEYNDLDICPGHSANGDYHTHSNPTCMATQMDDPGTKHSPIYGFAADGYPIYGPYHANGVLTHSCWKTRNYDDPASKTGCGTAGARSCLLVDKYDITKGVSTTTSVGPTTSERVTSLSGNVFTTTSGYYLQDYYYDATCTTQDIEFLDEHNGHTHDDLGYHYHVSVEKAADGSLKDVFPFYVGPRYAGKLQDNAIATCNTGAGPGGGPPGGGPPNFAAVAAELKITEQQLRDALGAPPPDLAAAAKKLGITEDALKAALDKAR